jgi:hypothetical protein
MEETKGRTPASPHRLPNATDVYWADSSGYRKHHDEGGCDDRSKAAIGSIWEGALLSPGRPPVAGRDERRRFWAAIAAGMASKVAAIGAGVPQAVGTRWFRKAGGMPPAMSAPFAARSENGCFTVSLTNRNRRQIGSGKFGLRYQTNFPNSLRSLTNFSVVQPLQNPPRRRSRALATSGALCLGSVK